MLFLLRQNPVQQAAAELFGVSQSTVSRRLTRLGPVLERVLTEFVPDPTEASRGKVVPIDGTLVTTWGWRSVGTELFSGKVAQRRRALGDFRGFRAQVDRNADDRMRHRKASP